jgi:arsenate reductase
MSSPYNVLFLCTGNSARSILAESLLNARGRGRFKAYSAGSHPTGRINPYALELLTQSKLPTEGLRSKSWEEFTHADAPVMNFLITVCDSAAGEVCPVWPGQPFTAHWGVPDPAAAVQGTDEQQRRAFVEAFTILERRISLLLNLPFANLDRAGQRREVSQIGEQ